MKPFRETMKVGVSGVRGIVGESFTPLRAVGFAQAFGTYVGQGAVLIGRDTRPSGPMLELAVIAGLQSVGCRPILAGVLPTPTLLYLTQHHNAAGAIAITASHNPAPWNALKFVNRRGLFLSQIHADELFDIYHQQDFPLVAETELAPAETLEAPMARHFDAIRRYVDTEAIRRRRFRVAVDCCNGVGALHTALFLEELGCDVVTIHDGSLGRFERPPEPLPQHLTALCETVRDRHCVIGFAQDPDGDRLALVDEAGTPLGEDLTLALGIQQVLTAHQRGPVAVNQSSSLIVEDVAAPFGVEVFRTPTGEINVSEAMLAHGAVAGGENNGGLIVPAIHPCRDSYVAMALILELLATSDRPISALRAALPRYHVRKEKMTVQPGQAPELIRAFRRRHADQDLSLIDGVRVNLGDHWIQVRRSNTESVVRIIAESRDADQVDALVADTRALFDGIMSSQY